MLLNLARTMGVGIAGMALASPAWGADGANVTTANAASAKLGGEFRSELSYYDHGLDKMSGYTPDKSTTIAVQAAKIKLSGNINDNTEYGFRFNLLGSKSTTPQSPLEYGWGQHWFNKMIGMKFGKDKVLQGGFDNWDNTYRTHHFTAYRSGLVFDRYVSMVALTLNVAGKVQWQLFDDVQGDWNTTKHPTWALGWVGEFGDKIMPLVNLGSYDNNKSRWIDVGVKASMAGLNASLDIFNRNHVNKYPDPADAKKNKEVADVGTGIAVNVGYKLDFGTPWVHFSTWELKQGEDSDLNLKDSKVNSTCSMGASADEISACSTASAAMPGGDGKHMFDDNATSWGAGVDLGMMGKGWTPYVALAGRSGKFAKDTDPTKEESKSEMWVRLGVLGEL